MTQLSFEVLDIEPESYAVSPKLSVRVRVRETTAEQVHAIALSAQVRIEPQRRKYDDAERAGMVDLFGEPGRWGQSLRPFQWTQCSEMVQGFRNSREFDLPMAVSYDYEVAASKYLHALSDGEVPLSFGFGGTLFTRGGTGFSVERISWEHDVAYRMPVEVWRRLVRQHFPNTGWLRLEHETLDELQRFKSRRGLLYWDDVCRVLLKETQGGQ